MGNWLAAPLPSLDWVLWRLTGAWVQIGEMIKCPLPGHDDKTPSFSLWGDHGDLRFGCYGCGRRGSVLDFISEMEKLDDSKAVERAEELRAEEDADTEEHDRKPAPDKKPSRHFPTLLRQLDDAFGIRELSVLQRIMAAKGMGGEEIEQYAMDEWGWTVGDREANATNALAIPHRNRDGEITGIKYRTVERKWAEDGSSYPSLYGAWRDKGHRTAIICEGETDTVWTAYHLKDEAIDVFAMPSGAGQALQEEWLEQLKDRIVIIATDGDDEGMRCAKRWMTARNDALLIRVPEEEDILSSGIPVRELLEHARAPRRGSGMIVVSEGIFAKKSKDGSVPVADFAAEPVRELLTDEGPAWEVRITGDRELSLIRASDLHSTSTITRWANKHGRSWVGTGPAVQGVFNWLSAASAFLPLERATTKAGKIGRSFVGPEFCIGSDRLRYIPPVLGDAKLESRLAIEQGVWDEKTILAIEQLNDPAVMSTILGWLCASLLRGKRAPAPPLFVSGESGAGKTHLLSKTLGAFGFNAEINLTTTTPYGVDCLVNSSVGFPVWFDEYRGGAREDSMGRLRQLLRDAYNGQPSMKGGMTNQATELTEVSTWAGIVVSGEMSSHETSHRDRLVMIDLDPDKKNRKAYQFLVDDPRRTLGLGWELLDFLSRRPDVLFKIRPTGDRELPDRFRDTLGFVQAGWDAWKEFRWERGKLHDKPRDPDWAMLGKERAEAEDPWLEALKACEGVTTRDGYSSIVSRDENGDVILIPSEVILEAKRVGIELPARANELIQWLKRRYHVEDTRVDRRRAKRVKGMKL